jgi:hypothetical protein
MKKFKILGYIIFFLSCFLWALIFIIPWLGFSKKQIAGFITILIIAGEITFYLSIFILGKSFIDTIKSKFKFFKKTNDNDSFLADEQK